MSDLKILTLDIETAPHLADVWDLWRQNVSLNQLRSSSYILCWAAKWRHSKEIYFGSEWTNPTEFIEEAWNLIDEADAVVTYNGDHFDLPTLNREFLVEGFGPPSPYRSIDLYKVAKRRFKFASNKMVYLCEQLGIGSKLKHEGHGLWTKVVDGDAKAQERMKRYCVRDVYPLTEKLHDRLLPWITNYPNRTLYTGSLCVRCESGVLTKRGRHVTENGIYQTYRCSNCKGWQRDTKRIEGVDVRSQ